MGKRKKDTGRRMHKRPKQAPGYASSSGGGGPARRTSLGNAVPPGGVPTRTGPPATPSSSSSSGGVGPARRTSAGTAVLPGGVPTRTGPPATPSPRSSSGSAGKTPPSATSGSAAATGGAPSPVGTTPPSGGGITAASMLTGASTTPPVFLSRRATPPSMQSQYNERYNEAEKLLTHLESHFTEEADALWSTNKFHLKVDFEDFRRLNQPLAHEICNGFQNSVQSGKEFYIAALRTFLLEHFQSKPLDGRFESLGALRMHIEEHANLSFTHLPKSITTFGAIIKSRTVQIFAGEGKIQQEAIEAAPVARIFLFKILNFVLENHKKGLCLDGNWSLNDWEIINDRDVSILKKLVPRTGRSNSDTDIVQIANTILPTFKISGSLPCFMQHLQDELNNLPLKPGDPVVQNRMVLSDQDFFGWFYAYLQFHPALMSPLARSNLLQGFYFTMDKLDYRKRAHFNTLFNELMTYDWRVDFHPPRNTNNDLHKVAYDVFWHKRVPCKNIMPHQKTYGGMLGFHRHLVQHTPDHGRTKWVKPNRIQSMLNSDEAELIAALHDEKLLPEFIKKLFVLNKMGYSEFQKHWKAYTATWSNQS